MFYSIDFIIYPDVLGLDISGPLEVFHVASRFLTHFGRSDSGYKIRFAALKKGEYFLSSGLKVIADADLDEKPPAHTLVVPGGDGVQKASTDPVFIDKIRHKCLAGKRIVSVCNGSFILASAGILDNRRATTHWMMVN
jgi:transcriptional regulator GlxA family with amidase domain